MLELIALHINCFRCFVEPQTISFNNRDKLVQIDGRNENTGGSSGSGKTTTALALDYLLGVCDIPATVLQSRLTKEGIEVEGEFLYNNKLLIIKRSKKNGLYINLDGEITSGNSKIAEEKLDEIIGIPRKIFKKMIHKQQKEGGFFLDMTAKEIYQFLVEMLNLKVYIDKEQEISIKVKDHKQKIESLQNEVKSIQESVSSLQMVLDQKQKPQVSLEKTKEVMDGFEKMVTDTRKALDNLKSQKQEEVAKILQPVKSHIGPMEEIGKLTEAEAEFKKLGNQVVLTEEAIKANMMKIVERKHLIESTKTIGSNIASLKEKKAHIELSSCPTCKQTWVGDTAKQETERLSSEIDRLTTQALDNKRLIEEVPTLEANETRLNGIKTEIQQKMDVQNEVISALKTKIANVKSEHENEFLRAQEAYRVRVAEVETAFQSALDRTNQDLTNYSNEFTSIQAKYQAAENAHKAYEQEVSQLNTMIQSKKLDHHLKESEINKIKQTILISEESARLIKTYVLHTFQETLDLIGEMATDILSSIPNMQTSTIYFEGCKETKSGSLKDEVNAIINIDGNNAVPIKSLSGGERTSVDLAVDLAVIDVIEAKSNKGADFYIIDEPFDGLDSVCKENYLEIIKQVDTNKRIIIVDHSSELKEMVSDIITVVKNGESSKIVA